MPIVVLGRIPSGIKKFSQCLICLKSLDFERKLARQQNLSLAICRVLLVTGVSFTECGRPVAFASNRSAGCRACRREGVLDNMIKRRRSGPLLPYANIRPTKQSSSTTIAVKRYVLHSDSQTRMCTLDGMMNGVQAADDHHCDYGVSVFWPCFVWCEVSLGAKWSPSRFRYSHITTLATA